MNEVQPGSKRPNQTQCFHIYEGQTLVLTVWDEPGSLRSTAAPASDAGLPDSRHPFIDAQAHDPASEHELREILLAAASFEAYLQRLLAAGFDISAAEALELGSGHRIFLGRQLVGAVWQGNGLFSSLGWPPERQGPVLSQAILTAYDADHAVKLRELAASAKDHEDLISHLKQAGYELKPLGWEPDAGY